MELKHVMNEQTMDQYVLQDMEVHVTIVILLVKSFLSKVKLVVMDW